MPQFTLEEMNLICLYEGENRCETIRELENMQTYLMPDERALRELSDSVLQKLRQMTDSEYDAFALRYLIL